MNFRAVLFFSLIALTVSTAQQSLPRWIAVDIPAFEKRDVPLNSKAQLGYRVVFASPEVAVMKLLDTPPHTYRYVVANVESHPDTCFNQFNGIGAQSYGVALLARDTVIFEKGLRPQNHHYYIGRELPASNYHPKSGETPQPLSEKRNVQMLPAGPGLRLLRGNPFVIVEAPGEYRPADPSVLKPMRVSYVQAYGSDERLQRAINEQASSGLYLCDAGPISRAVSFCFSEPAAAPREYVVVRLKEYTEISERLLNPLGAKGFRVIHSEHSGIFDARVILEHDPNSPQNYEFRVIPLPSGDYTVLTILDQLEQEGFEPAQVSYYKRDRFLILQRAKPPITTGSKQ